MPQDYTLTTDFVYLRFHGLKGGAYHDYTTAELKPWAHELARAARRGFPAYVYFNNDLNTRAPLNAEALMQLLDRQAVPSLASDGRRSKIGAIKPPVIKPASWPDNWVRPASGKARSRIRRRRKNRKPRASRPASTRRPAARRSPLPVAAAAIYSAPRQPLGR